MRAFFAFLCAAALVCSCAKKEVVVSFEGGKTRIESVSDNILRVSSVPSGVEFPKDSSLVVLKGSAHPSLAVSKTDSTVRVSAPKISAVVRLDDGSVSFYDASGKLLTSEKKREFKPFEADGKKAWTVRQSFSSPDDEAFFGLGQHQADEWNYKGKDEDLYQYNTKISIPFVVSSRRYGLLWDSYSFCRWGDPRDYSQLGDVFKLYDAYGVEGALTGTYKPVSGPSLVRRETSLAQDYLRVPDCDKVVNAPDFDFSGSSVLYEGSIEPSEDGVFKFYLYYAGYVKVYVDGQQVMPEIWRTAWNPNGRKFQVCLKAGVRTPLRIEWVPDGAVSYCGLSVRSPLPDDEAGDMSWWGEMQEMIDYYVIAGDSVDSVISGYRSLTGQAQVMPKWAFGYWQSRERYSTQEELVSTLAQMRSKGIPVDNIVQDWCYWEPDQWGSHEFDKSRYPDPKAMIDSIHSMNGRFMISVWPKFYENTEHFKEFDSKGWMYRTAITDSVEDWLGYRQSFYDAYSDGARRLFWKQIESTLYPLGVDAWWMDASEPNVHDCTDMDYRKKLCGPTALGPSAEYFNAYALMNAKAIYEGQRSADSCSGSGHGKRVFLLTRNGFSGLQRYSTASWSGDIGTRWEDMKAQVTAGLNYSVSGVPMWGQDIGGFSVEKRYVEAQKLFDATGKVNSDLMEWRELQVRWHEWGIFCPIYRAHGQWPFREPYNLAPEGDPTYEAILSADRLRYALMPYIYSMAGRVHFDDYTIMRPLVMDFTDDATALGTDDEFMFGDAFLVCPVCEYKSRSREVYLPEGLWYDWHSISALLPSVPSSGSPRTPASVAVSSPASSSGSVSGTSSRTASGAVSGTAFSSALSINPLRGKQTIIANAPYDHIPVYVRAGQIVPIGPAIQYTSQDDGSSLTLLILSGADATYTLYEDNGIDYGYEQSEYSEIDFNWNDSKRTLIAESRRGSFTGMAPVKNITVFVVGPQTLKHATLTYRGSALNLTL